MGFFDFFSNKKSAGDQLMQLSAKMYRGFLPENTKLTDEDILNVIHEVIASFKKAAEEKNDTISGGSLLTIAAKFLLIYDKFGEQFYYEHLNYEINKYFEDGLREDYKKSLF